MGLVRSSGFSDPGWEHGVAQDSTKKKVKCNYCGKIVSGGIYRLKQHLARISGQVTHCMQAPEVVYLKMKDNLKGCRALRKRQSDDDEQSFDLQSEEDEEDDEESVGYKRKRKQGGNAKSMVVSTIPLRSFGYVDPGWEYGVAQDETKKKVKCNYCKKIVSGGINRFKQHLARIPGEVAFCKMAPEEVYLKMKENMKWHRTGMRVRSETKGHVESDDDEELSNCRSKVNELIDDKDIHCNRITRRRFKGRPPGNSTSGLELQLIQTDSDSKNAKTRSVMPIMQSKLKTCSDKSSHKEVISAVCKFFYHSGIPFDAADSPYFHKMLDLVGRYGQGLKSPSSKLISGQFLQHEAATIKEYFVEVKASWTTTACSILADTWKDVRGRTLITFLVSCPRGTYFISSVDASDIVEDASDLFKLLDRFVEEVGEENVVQVVTQNTPSYRAAGKMLEERRRHLFWTPCIAYSIDQLLEDFAKIKLVAECIDKGQKITKFIYNQSWLLNLMKKEFTAGRELLKPAATRLASSFTTLQSILEHKSALTRMFQSSKWVSSELAKLDEGKEVEKIVFNPTFWRKMKYVNESVEPVVNVLKKADSKEGLSMPSVFYDMYRAKLAMKAIHGDEQRKYGPFLQVIDNQWNSLFNHPLYVAAYFLNPSYRYRPDFMPLPEVIRGLNECITRLEPDNGRRISAATQISDFVFAKADFGTELAISTRMELDPASWWQQHGINCLELHGIAVRILSQTCLSIGCEKNFSLSDHIHRPRSNRLAQKYINELAYVHYNLRLRERQLKRTNDSVSPNNVLFESLLDDWIGEAAKPVLQSGEDMIYSEMEQAEAYVYEATGNGEFYSDPSEMVDPEPTRLCPSGEEDVDLDDNFSE